MSMWICPNHGYTNSNCCDNASRVRSYDHLEWRGWPEFCPHCGLSSVRILTSINTPLGYGNVEDNVRCVSCRETGVLVVRGDDELHIEWREI